MTNLKYKQTSLIYSNGNNKILRPSRLPNNFFSNHTKIIKKIHLSFWWDRSFLLSQVSPFLISIAVTIANSACESDLKICYLCTVRGMIHKS